MDTAHSLKLYYSYQRKQRYFFYLYSCLGFFVITVASLIIHTKITNHINSITTQQTLLVKRFSRLIKENKKQKFSRPHLTNKRLTILGLALLNKITDLLPPSVWLTHFKINRKEMLLSGKSINQNNAIKFQQKISLLENISVNHFILNPDYTFTIQTLIHSK